MPVGDDVGFGFADALVVVRATTSSAIASTAPIQPRRMRGVFHRSKGWRFCRVQPVDAIPTIGARGGLPPSDPAKGLSEKSKTPPSEATMR